MPDNGLLGKLKSKVQTLLLENKEQDENELVTIATFQPVMRPHAQFLQAKLESEDIVCIMNGQWFTEADFVRLQVRRGDAARATAMLEAAEND